VENGKNHKDTLQIGTEALEMQFYFWYNTISNTKNIKMPAHVKATIALPFTSGLIALGIYLLITHPALLLYPLLIVSFLGILGSIWYALYRSFGGEI
jgi:hypothetical protein